MKEAPKNDDEDFKDWFSSKGLTPHEFIHGLVKAFRETVEYKMMYKRSDLKKQQVAEWMTLFLFNMRNSIMCAEPTDDWHIKWGEFHWTWLQIWDRMQEAEKEVRKSRKNGRR